MIFCNKKKLKINENLKQRECFVENFPGFLCACVRERCVCGAGEYVPSEENCPRAIVIVIIFSCILRIVNSFLCLKVTPVRYIKMIILSYIFFSRQIVYLPMAFLSPINQFELIRFDFVYF